VIWYTAKLSSINIQTSTEFNAGTQVNKLELVIDEAGAITSLFYNGEKHVIEDVPNEYASYLEACFNESLRLASDYRLHYIPFINFYQFQITLIERGLKEIPEYHLREFSMMMDQGLDKSPAPQIKIIPLGSKLEDAQGNDSGGLARNYVDSLFASIMEINKLSLKKTPSNLHFPIAKDPSNNLNQSERDLYRDIGRLLMFCYNSISSNDQSYRAGPCFESAVIAGALAFNSNEIETPFHELKVESKKKCINAILMHLLEIHQNDVTAGEQLANLNTVLSFLDWKPGDADPTDKELGLLYDSWLTTQDEAYDDEDKYTTGLKADLKKIKGDINNFIPLATSAALSTRIDAIGMPALKSCLAPIHQIAVGMKSACNPGTPKPSDDVHWDDTIQKIVPMDFSLKAQGSIDRKQMAQMFELVPFKDDDTIFSAISSEEKAEIKKKIGWLAEWIQDEKKGATDKELMLFLKFATGSSSFIPAKNIQVVPQALAQPQPDPISHTCFNKIEISPVPCGNAKFNDRDAKSFIKCLKAVCLPDDGFTLV